MLFQNLLKHYPIPQQDSCSTSSKLIGGSVLKIFWLIIYAVTSIQINIFAAVVFSKLSVNSKETRK